MTEPDRRTDSPDDQSDEQPDDQSDEQPDDQSDDPPEGQDAHSTDAADAAASGGTADGDGAGDDRSERVRRALTYGAIGVLSLFALVAAFRFYTQASAAITDWIAPAYRSLFQAVFNLVVLLLAGGGVAYLVRQLGE